MNKGLLVYKHSYVIFSIQMYHFHFIVLINKTALEDLKIQRSKYCSLQKGNEKPVRILKSLA